MNIESKAFARAMARRDYGNQWLRGLPDDMLDCLASEGNEAAWNIVEARREEYARTSMPVDCHPTF